MSDLPDRMRVLACKLNQYGKYPEPQAQNMLMRGANALEDLEQAIDRSPFDISPCGHCGKPVVCIPDGLPICEPCAEAEAKRQNPTRGGFTLVELMIIIGVLATFAGLCFRHFSPRPEKVEPTPEQVEAQQWRNIGTIPNRSELVILPTGERLLILLRYGNSHSITAVLLPPLPVREVER